MRFDEFNGGIPDARDINSLPEIPKLNGEIELVTDRNTVINKNKEGINKRYRLVGSLLTEAERKLYKALINRIPNKCIVCCKVRLADIITTDNALGANITDFRKIAMKHVDFVIVNNAFDIICVVELDDYTHKRKDRIKRDKFVDTALISCGIRVFRIGKAIDKLTNYDLLDIENHVYGAIAPRCPACGLPMEVKTSRAKFNYGHRFYGCIGFYSGKCNRTIDID